MAGPSRTSQFNKVHKVLKKHYQMVAPVPERTVFEQLVFACCLEDAHYDKAELAYGALCDTGSFFDWNEIRVSTVRELAEAMACLPDPPAAANRVKRVLQGVFESAYSFELEDLRKQNLGPAVAHLKKLDGVTNFALAYVTQSALGGHAIPVDAGVLGALRVVELVSDEDVRALVVPGLERAIAKSKGIEFASQLHQLGADFVANPYAPHLHQVLLEINPEARPNLPKRRARRRAEPSAGQPEPKQTGKRTGKQASAEAKQPVRSRKRRRAANARKSPEEMARDRDQGDADKESPSSPGPSVAGEQQPAAGGRKRPSAGRKRSAAKKKGDDGGNGSETAPDSDTAASTGLSKRKPR
jgi:endonuclease III